MANQLSLRLRVFLFFCLMAIVNVALLAGALAFGVSRSDAAPETGALISIFVIFLFLNSGFMIGIWLLFDENIAKPIIKLSADLRLRAHSGVETPLDTGTARYLGDLGPAAGALSETMQSSVVDAAERIAHETQRLRGEKERLTALLSEIPVASILLNPAREIVLYDAQAAIALGRIAAPRLKAPISDYFDTASLEHVIAQLSPDDPEAACQFEDISGRHSLSGRVKALGDDGYLVLLDVDADIAGKRQDLPGLVFDFDLIAQDLPQEVRQTPLANLTFVPFDTETTGLSVAEDAIVQIGAVRVVNGRIVAGEEINTLVNPERPIPEASTKIHHISDADVKEAPKIGEAGRALHHFCRDAVLVAHNAPFDIGLLRRFQAEMQVDWPHPVLDTVLLSAVVFGTTEDHTLDALCNRLAVDIDPDLRHTALGDAMATAEVLVKLLPLLAGKGLHSLGDVIEQTQTHARLLNDLNE